MDHALPVCLRQTIAYLESNLPHLAFRQRSRALDPVGECLAIHELHGEKVHFPKRSLGGVQVVQLAHIEMADLAGGARPALVGRISSS